MIQRFGKEEITAVTNSIKNSSFLSGYTTKFLGGDELQKFETEFELLDDGSGTTVLYREEADTTEVKFITSVVFSAIGNGITYGQFLSKSGGGLSNGIEVSFQSKEVMVTRPVLQTTEDFDDLHAGDPDDFSFAQLSGGDKYMAVLNFSVPLEIRPQGEFVIDDFLQVKVQDSLLSGISDFRVVINGFAREF